MKSVVYSLYIMLLKFHGSPPTARLNALFMLYSLVMSFELILSAIFLLHIMNPFAHVWNIGFAFLFILPGLTIVAPLFGVVATISGSPRMMMIYSSMNATMCILTYPLTIFTLFFYKDQVEYVGILLLLVFNKIFISFYGGKVR